MPVARGRVGPGGRLLPRDLGSRLRGRLWCHFQSVRAEAWNKVVEKTLRKKLRYARVPRMQPNKGSWRLSGGNARKGPDRGGVLTSRRRARPGGWPAETSR